MKLAVKPALVLSGVLASLLFPQVGRADTTVKNTDKSTELITPEEEARAPTQFQLGSLPPIDVGMAVSGSSQKFMRFDRIADKLQAAGRSIENGEDAQQAERDARLNSRVNADPERAPSEGRANQQGHKAVGVSLQTTF